ncbi:NDP-sugar synthase [bacterium]|nr:NDP-sugar synthase [bacterium]
MRALVLAGGEGKRLKPITNSIPKILLPICNKPTLCHLLECLKESGIFEEVVLSLGNLSQKVISFLSNYEAPIPIRVRVEEEPLDTGGAIKFSAPAGNEFFVINGDIICDVDYQSMLSFHKAKKADITILTVKVNDISPFGSIFFDGDFRVKGFSEKTKERRAGFVNGAIYIINQRTLQFFPDRKCSLEREIFPRLLSLDNIKIFSYLHFGYWMDIGERERYIQLHKDILDSRYPMDISAFSPDIEEGAEVGEPAVFGMNCRIGKGARVLSYSVMGNDVVIENGSEVGESVLFDKVRVGEGSRIHRSIVGEGCFIPQGSTICDMIIG